MKFSVDGKDISQAIGCIESGHLYLQVPEGTIVFPGPHSIEKVPSFAPIGGDADDLFGYRLKSATTLLFPGDKITITL